jgi:hypothetical protein
MKANKSKWGIFLVQMIIFFLPMILVLLVGNNTLNKKQLAGDRPARGPKFTLEKLRNGDFGRKTNRFLKDHWPYRAFFVRMKNQIDFALFHETSNDRIIVGENRQLFARDYVDAYLGKDLIERDSAELLIRRIAEIRDTLKKYGTDVMVMTPPGTPTTIPELMPPFYQKQSRRLTNRELFSQLLAEYEVPEEDFGFLGQKPEAYFPKRGLHWSVYGSAIAADSFYQRLVRNYQAPPLEIKIDSALDDNWWSTDLELERSMNLLKKSKGIVNYKPIIKTNIDSLDDKFRIIIVGDSYYKLWYDLRIQSKFFHEESQFWYYGFSIFPKRKIDGKDAVVPTIDIMGEWKKADLVIFQASESNLPKLGFGVLERS